MKVFKTVKDIQEHLHHFRKDNSIGFVPTMGALHEGHLSLINEAGNGNDIVVVSIFVNPTQFNNPEDLKKYPRTLVRDLNLLENTGCDIVFAPSESEVYDDFTATPINLGILDSVMEGKYRPGHFKGVAQVVERLFRIVQPNKAYFGIKDFQQVAVIKEMVKQTNLPVEIVECDIIREEDGLAMSSRNRLLNDHQRAAAPLIYETIQHYKNELNNNNRLSVASFIEKVKENINKNPNLDVQYFEVVDSATLLPIKDWEDHEAIRACIAVFCGEVRLIDNMKIK